jgi:hypothetical protein
MPAIIPVLTGFKKSRWYKRLLWAGALFLVYTLFGFFVLPPIVQSQLLKRLPAVTKRQVAVRQVKFNPLVLSLTIRGLSLTEPDGQVFASWEELYVNFQLSSLVRFAWTFAEISLKQPYGHIMLLKDGQLNFANMFGTEAPPPKPAKSGGLPRVNVWRLHIDDGVVAFDDQTHRVPLHTEFKPINILLTNLTTRVGKNSVYSFEASSDSGRKFAWAGSLVMQPFESRGRFELAGGELSKWTPVLRDYLRAEITEGRFNVSADYALAAGTNGFDASLKYGLIVLAGLKVKDLNTGEIVTTLRRLSLLPLDFDLRQRNLHVGQVKLTGYTKTVRIEKDGSLNLGLLVEPQSAKPAPTNATPSAPSAPWTLSVDDLSVSDAAISFADLSRPSRFETTLKPIAIRVQRFTTRPDSDAAYDFTMPTEAGETVSGKGTFSIAPLRSAGAVKLAALEIKKYAPYFQDLLRGEVLAGKLGIGMDYRFAAASNAPLLTVSNAEVALTDFELKAADTGETIVGIPAFAVKRAEASLAERTIQVGLVESTGGTILARQKKDGTINLLGLVNPPAANPAPTNAPKSSEPPWTVLLKEIAFDGYSIKAEDQKLTSPATLSLDQLTFNLKGVSTLSNALITASLSTRLNEAGTVAVEGTAKIAPVMADLNLTVSDVDLRPFQPYLTEQIRLAITSGRFNTKSRVRYTPPGTGAPLVKFTGEISLTNLVTTDQVLFKEFVKWDALNVSGIDFALQPNQLQLQEVKWRGLQTSVVIGPDGRPNLNTILPEKSPQAAPSPAVPTPSPPNPTPDLPPPPKSAEFPIALTTLENASLHFSDQSVTPPGAFDVQELGGTVKGLSSQEQSTATVDLRGKVDAGAPFSISGKVNPLAKDLLLDLTVAFTNTDLTAFTTYLEKYAGHPLNKGKLTMELHYDINQKQLKAQNKLVINHFTLGPRNDNTNATSLPVKLAVALLKDRNGQINLDIPVTGRTDDPQFKLAPIIFKVIVNLIMKAATSPFSLLGALVGGGEELSFIEFTPGQSDIPDTETQKLDKLVKALDERPALSLEIAGSFDPEKDREAVARLKLEQQLKTLRLKELARGRKAVPSLETLQLEPAQRERLLKQVLADLGTNQTLVVQAPASAPETNIVAALSTNMPPAPVAPSAPAKKSASKRPLPTAPDGTPLTVDQIQARLVTALEVSEDDRRGLIKQRAQAVQAAILKTGKVAADRLFIVTPKSPSATAKGESRVNLSLN